MQHAGMAMIHGSRRRTRMIAVVLQQQHGMVCHDDHRISCLSMSLPTTPAPLHHLQAIFINHWCRIGLFQINILHI
jgi:hypothetical protein